MRYHLGSILLVLVGSSLAPSVTANVDINNINNNIRQRRLQGDYTNTEAPPNGPVQVGDKISTSIGLFESSAVSPVASSDGTVLNYEIRYRPGAPYTTVHFSGFNMGETCQMEVSGNDLPDGRHQSYTMDGLGKMQLGTFWTQHVKGDTMFLKVTCPPGVQAATETYFEIDEVAVGFVSNEESMEERGFYPESLCGIADFQNISCKKGTKKYSRGKAVARLLIGGTGWCTGFLISEKSHFITNEHCLTTQADADNIDFEFDAEAPSCRSLNCPDCHPGTIYSGATLLKDNSSLDYALLKLSKNPASRYGFLEVDDRDPLVGEQIYVVQHPAKRAKEISASSSHPNDNGKCLIHSTKQRGCTSDDKDIGYYCDTEGGSSGSPVLSAYTNKVIALHHCGGCLNSAVPMNKIWAEIADKVTGSPAPTPAPGDKDKKVPTAAVGTTTACGSSWNTIAEMFESFFSW